MGKNTIGRKISYGRIAENIVKGSKRGEVISREGYGEVVSKEPTKITKRKTFQELLNEMIPEELVLDQHKRLYTEHREIKQIRIDTLDDYKIKKAIEGFDNVSVIKKKDEGYTLLIINEVDQEARKTFVDMAHKLRGSYSPTRIEVKREFEDVPDSQLFLLLKGKFEDVDRK